MIDHHMVDGLFSMSIFQKNYTIYRLMHPNSGLERRKSMNSKNKKIFCILIMAVILSVIGGIAIYQYLNPKRVTVYVFNDNYEAGTVLKSTMLTSVNCDAGIIVAGKKTDTSSRFVTGADIAAVLETGDSLRMDVSDGMPLTLAMLSVNGGSSIEMSMDPSKVAVTVPVSNVTGVTRDLKEGSRVNVYATGFDASSATTLIFQKLRVLAVNRDQNGNLASATLEVTAEESLKLIYGSVNSTISLGLVDTAGYPEIEIEDPVYAPGMEKNEIAD